MLKTIAVALTLCVWMGSVAEARERLVNRELDCMQDMACIEKYIKEKAVWTECLKQAGASEKKIRSLSEKLEATGIRNLKKKEILTFNSERKDCHKNFMEALSHLKVEIRGKDSKEPSRPSADPVEKNK